MAEAPTKCIREQEGSQQGRQPKRGERRAEKELF